MSIGILALVSFSADLKFLLLVLLGLTIILVTFIRVDLGLILLILSMLLSPEIKVGEVTGRDIIIRLDDLLIVLVFLTWVARLAIYKEISVFKSTILNKPIWIYVSCCVLLTLFGMVRGDVNVIKGLFYLLKYLEYFLIYFMVVNILQDKSQPKLYLIVLLITAGIVCLYSAAHIGKVARISAPFEGAGEPNTLGGYLIIMTGCATGLALYAKRMQERIGLIIFIGLALICIGYTLSRCSYIALPFMYLAILRFSEKRRGLLGALLLGVIIFILFRPPVVTERINYTFAAQGEESRERKEILGIPIDPSANDRITSWREEIKNAWNRYPFYTLIGVGITGVGFIDGQYIKTYIELGLIGLIVFIYLLCQMYRVYLKAYRSTTGYSKGLALGLMGAFIGICVHALTANSFMIIRIQEPLWFLTAMIVWEQEMNSKLPRQTSSATTSMKGN
ncbi:MAG: hypothetical protein HY769_02250 [Candidatus Stahlbacteria bacterium]|nr:hypothetical protein [Candidatus Stahlbacteria bacterium]